MSLSMQNPQAP